MVLYVACCEGKIVLSSVYCMCVFVFVSSVVLFILFFSVILIFLVSVWFCVLCFCSCFPVRRVIIYLFICVSLYILCVVLFLVFLFIT